MKFVDSFMITFDVTDTTVTANPAILSIAGVPVAVNIPILKTTDIDFIKVKNVTYWLDNTLTNITGNVILRSPEMSNAKGNILAALIVDGLTTNTVYVDQLMPATNPLNGRVNIFVCDTPITVGHNFRGSISISIECYKDCDC